MLRQIIRGVLALPSHQELPPLHRGHSKQLSQTMLAATTAAVVVTQSRIKCPAGSPAVARQSQPTAVPCYRHEQNDNKTPNTPKQGEVRTFSCTYVGGSVSHGGHDGHPSPIFPRDHWHQIRPKVAQDPAAAAPTMYMPTAVEGGREEGREVGSPSLICTSSTVYPAQSLNPFVRFFVPQAWVGSRGVILFLFLPPFAPRGSINVSPAL
jgi:hypothetical protein